MANEREFTLVGKFDDQITKKLKAINEEIEKLSKPLKKDNVAKSLVNGFDSANKELKVLQKHLEQVGKFQMKFDKSGITAAVKETEVLGKTIKGVEEAGFEFDRSGIKSAIEEVKVLGETINSTAKAGFEFDRSGLKAAQEDAKILGEILKANAFIEAGQGFANALTTGATAAVNILQRGAGFLGGQFRAAVQDQMEDLQARGSLFGSLQKAGIIGGTTAGDMEAGYKQTKIISRANEQAIGDLIRTSSVSTGVVTTLNRQMTDNLLPTLLKARGITSLQGKSRDDLDKLFGGEGSKPGIGTELARLYEQMATVIPNPAYASMAAMGFTQVITSGTINRQLNVFENNPVLVDALKTIDGGIQGTADIGKRIQILKKALEVAAPTMMLDEMRQTIGGGFQAVQDTIMNPTVGILSLGADIANEGKKTLQQYKASGAYELQRIRTLENLQKIADKRKLEGVERQEFINKHLNRAMEKLSDAVESADSPIEKISVGLAPVLQSFGNFLSTFGNLLIGPVTSAMESLYAPMAALQRTLDYLATDVELFNKTNGKEGRSIGEALGRAFAEFFKMLAQYFNPDKAGKEIGQGINNFFSDFMKGFKSNEIDGEKYLKIVVDTLESIIMKLIFKEGNVTKGLTGLGDALVKVFALLAAPAFISALITGLVPIALMSMGSLIKLVFSKLATALLPKAIQTGTTAASGAAGRTMPNLSRMFITPGVESRVVGAGTKASSTMREYARSGWQSSFKAPIGPTPEHTFYKGERTAFMRPEMTTAGKFQGLLGSANKQLGLMTATLSNSKLGKIFSFVGKGAKPIGKGLAAAGKAIPGVGLLFAGLRVAGGMAGGERKSAAIGGGVGGLVGGMAGGALGALTGPLAPVMVPLLGMLGSWLGDMIGTKLGTVIADLPKKIGPMWESVVQWFRELPANLGFWIGRTIVQLGRLWAELPVKIQGWVNSVSSGISTFVSNSIKVIRDPSKWKSLVSNMASGLGQALSFFNPVNIFKAWMSGAKDFVGGVQTGMTVEGVAGPKKGDTKFFPGVGTRVWNGKQWAAATAFGSSNPFMGSLGEAINFEMANKPAGSHLVIANSSETIIPAAGGLGDGMRGVIAAIWGAAQQSSNSISRDLEKSTYTTVSHIGKGIERMSSQTSSTFARGFTSMQSSFRSGQAETTRAIERSLSITSRQNQQLLSAIKAAAAAGGFGGMGGMGLGGGYGSAGVRLAGMLGNFIKATGGAPGSIWEHPWHGGVRGTHSKDSYHYSGRAIDIGAYAYEQGGVISRVHQFNRKMGVRPVEFLHAGNDKGHQDHVHVAYAYGPGNPALFRRQKDAIAWEEKNVPSNLKVMSVTTNSGEAMGPGGEVLNKLSKIAKVMSAVGGNLCALMGTNRAGADTANSFTGDRAGISRLMSIAKGAGFTGRAAEIMAAIAMAESGGDPGAHNRKPPDNSYGLWQINMHGRLGPERQRQFGLRSYNDLFDPAINARAAFAISGGGVNFRPWSVYNNGAYKKFLPTLEHVAYALGTQRPAFFSSQSLAEKWEKEMIPSQFKVKTLTTNTGEMAMGGPTTINAPITIYQQPNQDPEELASIVTYRIGLAFNELRNHA